MCCIDWPKVDVEVNAEGVGCGPGLSKMPTLKAAGHLRLQLKESSIKASATAVPCQQNKQQTKRAIFTPRRWQSCQTAGVVGDANGTGRTVPPTGVGHGLEVGSLTAAAMHF